MRFCGETWYPSVEIAVKCHVCNFFVYVRVVCKCALEVCLVSGSILDN